MPTATKSTSKKSTPTKTARGGKLSAQPIMLYPASQEVRDMIVEAAVKATPLGQRPSTSNFVITTVLAAIAPPAEPAQK